MTLRYRVNQSKLILVSKRYRGCLASPPGWRGTVPFVWRYELMSLSCKAAVRPCPIFVGLASYACLSMIAFAPEQVQALSGVVSAASFGFNVGNSGSDNAMDLQKALNSGAKVVTIPVDVYDIGPVMVNVPSGVTLRGDSGVMLNVASGTGAVLHMLNGSTVTGIAINGDAGGVSYKDGAYGAQLDGLISVGDQTESDVSGVKIADCTLFHSTLDGVFIEHAGNIRNAVPIDVENCKIDSVYQGIETDYASNIRVYHNTVTNTKSAGVVFWGNVRDGINWVARIGSNIDCEYNTVVNAGETVLNASGGAGIWSSGCQGIVFSHNRIDGAQDGGVDMEWTCQGQMTDNTISRTAYGGVAMFFSSEDIVIANNHITNNVESGTNGPSNAGVCFAYPNKSQFSGDVGYKNVFVYNNTINNAAHGAWKQRSFWDNCDTPVNIQVFGNKISGDGPFYVGAVPTVVDESNNFTLNNDVAVPLSTPLPEIGDAGFEMPAVQFATSVQDPRDTIEHYCTFVGTAGIASNQSNLKNPFATDGAQVGYIQGYGSISQSVWFPAGSWTTSFFLAQQFPSNHKTIRVSIDGYSIGDYSPGAKFVSYSTVPILLSEGSHVLTFQGLDASAADTAFVDSISFAKTI